MALKKTADGTVDKRTKEGKAICERMAKARRAAAKGCTTTLLTVTQGSPVKIQVIRIIQLILRVH